MVEGQSSVDIVSQWLSQRVERDFPLLTRDAYEKTSDDTDDYNCLAWAAKDQSRWWEPPIDGVLDPGQYWPRGAPITPDISALIKAYERHGFEVCRRVEMMENYDVIALYAYSDGRMAHAARWLNTEGRWSSKMGQLIDISHDYLSALESNEYGKVRILMRRYNP
jgi:hypothetical protein